ncbi:MAG: ATP-binding protein [Gammaproteobacteria bacterium]|nr:ATP-binding protein [Gammaproteobacteria bacterium]
MSRPDGQGAGGLSPVVAGYPFFLLDELQTAVVLLDETLGVVYLNVAAETLLGVSARQVLGQPVAELAAEDVRYIDILRAALENFQPYVQHDMDIRLKHGGTAFVDSIVTPVEADGTSYALVEMVSTHRAQRIAMKQHLMSQYAANQAILGGLAHELKNPLGGIRGAAQLLEREFENPELQEYTQVIIGETDRLTTLLDRMMGHGPAQVLAPLSVHEVTERVRALLAVDSTPGIHIATDYDPSIPDLVADVDQLIQVVLNVARNAVQAMAGKGNLLFRTRIRRNVTLGDQLHRLAAVIQIVDDGPGIPPNMQNQIFSPLVTGRPEGTGLGLSIAQSLVHGHGGSIECSSQAGKTVFSVIVPVQEGPE